MFFAHRSSQSFLDTWEESTLVSTAQQQANIRHQELILFNVSVNNFLEKIEEIEDIVKKSNVTVHETIEMNSLNKQTLRQTKVSLFYIL